MFLWPKDRFGKITSYVFVNYCKIKTQFIKVNDMETDVLKNGCPTHKLLRVIPLEIKKKLYEYNNLPQTFKLHFAYLTDV